MINEACHLQVSNNRLEGKRNMEVILAVLFFVQASYTLEAHIKYQGRHPCGALHSDKTVSNEVMQ